jgi:hypothetical protein
LSILFRGFSPAARKQFRDAAAHLRTFLVSESIRLSPSSRLGQYVDALSDDDSTSELTPGIDALPLLHRALLEIDDLRLIAQYLPEILGPNEWRREFQRLIKGAALPSTLSHDDARDFQFEFITAAMLCRAGYSLKLAEPDVVINSMPFQIGVAAKRLASPNAY